MKRLSAPVDCQLNEEGKTIVFDKLPTSDQDFREAILVNSIHALKANRYTDNFDAARFNWDGADHSAHFDANRHAFSSIGFFEILSSSISRIHNWLMSGRSDCFSS
jgi:hypothetical protein